MSSIPIRRRGRTLPTEQRRIEVGANDILVYRTMELNAEVLDAIFSTTKRLLWAFVKSAEGDIMAVPYSEENVIWMADSDVAQPEDVEL